ncbi:dual 3',5'-cyclic-AMP and -GMP phosphodiesterase 11 [Caerostris extrusa]|uniref:Dual 3',5'-cyclic-AMP and -GMP phosphodiesterase 11 n=1 Tax=Caerostris extrusa TaxID=172846 RepID=A0AAV4P756_CAEEX|nr:dual 3',5'-cyclic-AMP and -GMP phosphodiesterase 11 [Caerostris extrusa]
MYEKSMKAIKTKVTHEVLSYHATAFEEVQALLRVSKLCNVLGELETLSLLIACLCHDLDHGGANNSFRKIINFFPFFTNRSNSPLAQLYSTSTMEHHHFDQCIRLLNSEGNQILSRLSSEEYLNVVHVLEDAILATDLTSI